MSVQVQLPPVLRNVVGGELWLEAEGGCIASMLNDLARRHPALALHLFDEQGAIRRNIVFLHGGALVRSGEASDHPIGPGDEVVLTNALAGG
jgi:molybdopterin synthase sulfur carrier subunit